MRNMRERLLALLGTALFLVNLASCAKDVVDKYESIENPDAISMEENYTKLTTGGKNAPYEVRFGEVSEKEKKEYKDLNVLVIDTAFGDAKDIEALHKNGNKKVLVYINVGALDTNFVEDSRFDDLKLGKYDDWEGEYWVDIRDSRWKAFIYEQAEQIAELGADGFFVDNLDVYGNYAEKDGMFEAAAEILSNLARMKSDVMINGADEFVTRAMKEKVLDPNIFSVNQETVYTHINFENRTCNFGLNTDSRYYMKYLNKCKEYGISGYLLEYGVLKESELEEIRRDCERSGFTYYVSGSIDLDERWGFHSDDEK